MAARRGHAITTLTGSALLALALAQGHLSTEEAWAAAHVDEDWNMEQWGRDEQALERRAKREAEMRAAALVFGASPNNSIKSWTHPSHIPCKLSRLMGLVA